MALSDLFNKQQPPPKPGPSGAAPPGQPPATVESLSKTMCDRKAVHWANESAKMAGPPMSAADQQAMHATDAWLKNPSAQTKAAAQEAALKAGHGGPGAWAAQAAAWSSHGQSPKAVALQVGGKLAHGALSGVEKPALAKLSAAAPGGAAPGGGLAALAVKGAVGLAAAMKAGVKLPAPGAAVPKVSLDAAKNLPKQTPEELAKMEEAHKPFIELGKKIAADPSIKC